MVPAPNVIVLSGPAGSGKDSIARYLVDQHGWALHSLSGPMKRFVGDLCGFTDEQLYGRSSARNAADERWARPCPACLAAARCCPSAVEGCVGPVNDNSPRRILCLLGEEYLRQMIHPDALTMRARPDIERLLGAGRRVVVNDGRHRNDRNNLREWFGAARVDVRNRCRKVVDEPWRRHWSELDLPSDDEVEHVINVDERWPFAGLPRLVDGMLAAIAMPRQI